MRAVRFRVARALRARWRSTLALGLIVAAVSGVVLALAAGAARTASAPDRYTTASGGGFDAEIQQPDGRPRTAEVAAIPGVSDVKAATFVFGGLTQEGAAPAPDAFVFAGSHHAVATRLVAGREPDLTRDEFVATRAFADDRGVALGTTFDVLTMTQEQADRGGFDAFVTDAKHSLKATLVGIVDGPAQLDDPTPFAVVPLSLLDDPQVGVSASIMSVRLRPGTDLASFRAALDTLPGGDSLRLRPSELVSPEVRTAVDGQAQGLWVLTAFSALVALVALGQLITREVRLSDDEAPRLSAIGFSKGQLVAEQVGRAAVPIVAGTVLGAIIATGLSFVFPTGFVRRIEPYPGVQFDATTLAVAGTAVLVALLLWILAAAALARPAARSARPSALVESVATRTRRAALSTGLRFAFTPSQRDRGSVRATFTGMMLTATLLVGAVVFGSSLGRMVTDGSRFGRNFDVMLGGSGGDSVPDELRSRLESDPDVTAVMLYGAGEGRVGAQTLGLAGMEPVKGDLGPTILAGRLPITDDEIALGRLAANSLATHVGADLTVEGAGTAHRFRVTGLAVVPAVAGLDGVGQDGIVTMGGLGRLDPEIQPSEAAIAVREGLPPNAIKRLAGLDEEEPIPVVVPPGVILNVARIRSVPFVLAWLVGTLMVLTVIHVMVTSVRRRRRDLAVLRSVGADGRWITRAVHWQATAFSLVPMVLAVPLGLIAGRIVFKLFADAIGAVPDPSFPYLVLTAVIAGVVALANVAAGVPARRARRQAAAPLLAAE